jgi:hypothetical protein
MPTPEPPMIAMTLSRVMIGIVLKSCNPMPKELIPRASILLPIAMETTPDAVVENPIAVERFPDATA